MVQPTLASFFKKPAAPASSNKRPLEEEGNATTTTKGEEGSADAATAQGKQKLGEEQDEQPRKKAAVEPSSSAPAATLTLSSLPEAVASHPVMQPVAGMDEGLRQVVLAEAGKPYFARLLQFLTQEANSKQAVYPPYPLVLNALSLCKWEDVRVVIIGQDPYHGPNQAHGLAFSVLPPTPPPPSLMNMYKEAMADVGIRKPTHGNLESWSRQGVLLLNTVLTVRRGQAHSHKGRGWETFTDAVIRELDKRASGLVFLLWGKPAQEKCRAIDRRKHRVIACAHPSPLSATKTSTPFIGSKCFSRCNRALEEMGKKPIDWNVV